MQRIGLATWLGALVLVAFTAPVAAQGARTVDVVDTYHGVRVPDPYRWLEDPDSAEVRDWTRAQNERLDAYLKALPHRTAIGARMAAIGSSDLPPFYAFAGAGRRVFALSNAGAQQPALVVFDGRLDPAAARVVLDPNSQDPDGKTSIDWFSASPDGKLVAVSLSRAGSELGTLSIHAVDGGRKIEHDIPHVSAPTAAGSLAWSDDSKAFWYTRYPGEERPEEERQFHQQVYFHTLGTDWRRDPLVLGSAHGVPRIGAIVLDSRNLEGRALARVGIGESWEFAHYLLTPRSVVRLAPFSAQILSVAAAPDGTLYALSRKNALNGQILRRPPPFTPLALERAPVVVAASDTAIESVTVTNTHLLVKDIVGGPNRIRSFTHRSAFRGPLPVPDMSAVGPIVPLADGSALFSVAGYLRPAALMRWSPAGGLAEVTAFARRKPYSFDDAEVVRELAVSKDGTRVPVDIIRRKGTALDGRNPVILYGYGGYGDSEKPHFAGAFVRTWLDAGGIYATAIIRGGGEFGERWHLDGYLTKKQNGFDDFAAVARHLIGRGYTSPAKLALSGQSNGGLLVGAVITQHPTLARAAVAKVGIFDALRTELEPNGAFNVTEFGTVKDPAQFEAMHAYSPYHRVRAGTAYPAVLLTTGENDGRVSPMHARKFAAALQAATSAPAPILLRVTGSGHGAGSTAGELVSEDVDVLAFLMDQLGVDPSGGSKAAPAREQAVSPPKQ